MNNRVRPTVQNMNSPMKYEKKDKIEKQGRRLMDVEKATTSRRRSTRERKLALIQDVDKLKKKLRHEESVHRALERAFTRPLGALPRLPPYLPQNTLELLAEVAVLEEEVVRLEEQIVNFRQGLYEEAVHISSSKRSRENPNVLYDNLCGNHKKDQINSSSKAYGNSTTSTAGSTQLVSDHIQNQTGNCSTRFTYGKSPSKRTHYRSHSLDDGRGKENKSCINSTKNNKLSPKQPSQRIQILGKGDSMESRSMEKHLDPLKLKLECRMIDQDIAAESCLVIPEERALEPESSSANTISEDVLKCLSSIFLRMSKQKNRHFESEMFSSLKKLASHESYEENEFQDPYGICKELGKRDTGQYKHLCAIEANSIDTNRMTNSSFLIQRLKFLLGKLASVDLQGLTHHQKLAFWINIYNSCMMNAFLEHGIPESPQMVIALMQKAMINVGGQSLNAMTIEHFILRLPYHSKYTCSKGDKNDGMKALIIFGLEWSEPLVTFALSCGSWSSPAVRVYTASQVENELEAAKKDYLQAAVGISSSNKIVIPKLLDWYLLDFAKDLESLLDWICLQLPSDLRNDAMKCLERSKREPLSQSVHVVPYEFSFRYLLYQ